MNAKLIISVLATALALGGCASTATAPSATAPLVYAAPANFSKLANPSQNVSVSAFVDKRGEPEKWVGAIRGGFGNALKQLETAKPVAELVTLAFKDALTARGISPNGTPNGTKIIGTIAKLDSNQIHNREGVVKLSLRVVGPANDQRFERQYEAVILEPPANAFATGIFADTKDLQATLDRTLNQAITKAVMDPEFIAALNPRAL